MAKVKTRFAPSPTGSLHIGGLRTALYAYALARHHRGQFILRIEDTDKKREIEGSRKEIETLLESFGLAWDRKYIQSKRLKHYQKAAAKLVKSGHAYKDKGAIRIKVPKGKEINYHDFALDKDISWQTDTLENLVLLKSNGFPTYHLAVVVDDHAMGITHVLRGHDWLPSTPIHLLLYEFLGFERPEIGHLTDILDPAGGKLSKRKKSASVTSLISEGYLPDAILNFVMLLGWAPKNNQEIFTLTQFVRSFNQEGLQKANPIFNEDKLAWMNGQYIRKMSKTKLAEEIYEFFDKKYPRAEIKRIIPLIKTRIKTLKEFKNLAGFFFKTPRVDNGLLTRHHKKHFAAAIAALKKGQALDKVPDRAGFDRREFFMDLRVAITGQKVTPPINESVVILGKKETLARLQKLA